MIVLLDIAHKYSFFVLRERHFVKMKVTIHFMSNISLLKYSAGMESIIAIPLINSSI